MKTFFKQLLTGKDNETYDIGRVTWLLGTFTVIVFAALEMSTSQTSLRELAEALGIVSAAGGASTMMKKDTEPQ
jgi:hypothetical protein